MEGQMMLRAKARKIGSKQEGGKGGEEKLGLPFLWRVPLEGGGAIRSIWGG